MEEQCKLLQQEEYDVIESIYPDCITKESMGLLKLEVPIEMEKIHTVKIQQDASLGHEAKEQEARLSMLPPILLSILLPPLYPLAEPPQLLSIRAAHFWLPSTTGLQQLLIDKWRGEAGILYEWIECLRTGDFLSSMELTGENDVIRLWHPAPLILAASLKSYESDAKLAQFNTTSYLCSICFTSQKGSKCLKLSCSHTFCRACLAEYWRLSIAEGDAGRVGCADPKCVKQGVEAKVDEVARVVTEEEVRRWKWLREKKIYDNDPTVVHCPTPYCGAPVRKPADAGKDDEDGWASFRQCGSCGYTFCALCLRLWHGAHTGCTIEQSEEVAKAYLAASEGSEERRALERRYGRGTVARLARAYEAEAANEAFIREQTTQCPKCTLAVSKLEGCNHMTCIRCSTHFCYRCGSGLDGGNPYGHFGRVGTSCYYKLFDRQWPYRHKPVLVLVLVVIDTTLPIPLQPIPIMDVYTSSFTYPRRSRHTHPNPFSSPSHQHPPHDVALPADADAIQKIAMMAMSLHGCHVSFLLADHARAWNFYISGAYQQVMATRGLILKECPIQHRAAIKVARSEILDFPSSKPSLKSEVRRRLDDIASQTLAHIAVVNSPLSLSNRTPPDGISSSAGWSGLETERVCELVITGTEDSVDLARVRLLVMLDELSGLHAERCEIDHKLHEIIAGRKRSMLQTIQEETATNIYYPSPLQGLMGPEVSTSVTSAGPNSRNAIWITGEFFGVQRARDMLFSVSVTKSKSPMSRDTAILPRKLDWMVTDRGDDLKQIMNDNATFIQFPPLGSSTSLITVYGDHRVDIQRTIRSIMSLACQYYVGSFWLLPVQFNALLPPATLNPSAVTNLLKQISISTGAEVVFKSMCFEMHGLEQEVRAAVSMIMDLDIIKAFHHEIRFQIELSNEHREFISGKKNGKINKIMQTTNVKIKFETFNDHNFLIDISGPDSSVLQGLTLLQEELPAEISFHVPETYHKRIIGVGGRSIQRIMKKYGVYVKFSNAEEFAALGGYNDNDDNVVARTPAKNAINLDNLKQSVMELVNPKDKDYINETVLIPRRYHRTLLGEKSIFIHDIESKTNSRVRFPDKETASDVVTIFGPESQVQIAASMLLDHVPFEADMAAPPSSELPRLCASPEFTHLVERVKRELQVSISPNFKVLCPSNGAAAPSTTTIEMPTEYSFKFRCQRSNSDFLITAREMLEQFLLNHNVHVYPSPTSHTHKRGDSFAEAFPHFDSKVLSTAKTRGHESMDLGRSEAVGDRRLRLANSSPDVKALFNSPAYIYNLEEREDNPDPSYTVSDYWTPLAPIGSGIHSRTKHADDALKRGSDSLLEAKLKEQIGKPRSLTNRAQSLDLTKSFSRLTGDPSSLIPPESPTTSTGDTGGNSSPTSVTFPSVYDHPMSSRTAVVGSSVQSAPSVEDIDEVSRVISNLGL
ncbi:hypothetical protein APHAL10511_006558 [Amanita phalloides]|nr:hypothetical protein APHAL10511_006558 [Amanita phalloides]